MNRLSLRQLLVFMLIFAVGISVCDAQTVGKMGTSTHKTGLFGRLFSKKNSKIKEPKKMSNSKRAQEEKKKKLKADYFKSVKESQKRTIKIQAPEVQERMKQNQKDITAREKAKKKKTSAANRKAGKKYKK
jgi:hypothetical protein